MSVIQRLLYPLAFPLRLVPGTLHSRALAAILNQVMNEALAEGELDFLKGRRIAIEIDDLGLRYRLGLENGRIRGYGDERPADASIAGGLHEFLLLAARREDADTLFFQRRLRMSGDTELGLYLKNFLDAFEPPARWTPLIRALERLADLRLPGRKA
ncbi:ubiquinone anaerobic biosynthesis accessory factor UbiT [Thermochromatium tepidum]|uniref:Ubiquinone biosynthesis accessory factor UbiT n=1 Tax=Thermochromatium tepidum ATCC 43061 TaxID=316276 RepID=A0A6I6E2Z3_THETI|nr:SCP2 sterol-binding domain-containing protein [Thermochromatium tepidum]QGU32102.1 sterol-binding protein [Thermochromatium tepidum ATCC 43061]